MQLPTWYLNWRQRRRDLAAKQALEAAAQWGPTIPCLKYLCDVLPRTIYPEYSPKLIRQHTIELHVQNVDSLMAELRNAIRTIIDRRSHVPEPDFASQAVQMKLIILLQTRYSIPLKPVEVVPHYVFYVTQFLTTYEKLMDTESDGTLKSYYERIYQPLFSDTYRLGRALLELAQNQTP